MINPWKESYDQPSQHIYCFSVDFILFIYFFALQYCIGFAIHQHEFTTGVHVFPILNPSPTSLPNHLSGSSQCTSPKHLVSCIEPRLAIHFLYDIIHASMPFSQIIPPSPSPTESKSLFFTSVSLLLFRIFSPLLFNLFNNCGLLVLCMPALQHDHGVSHDLFSSHSSLCQPHHPCLLAYLWASLGLP